MVAQRIAFVLVILVLALLAGVLLGESSALASSDEWTTFWFEVPLPPEFDSTCYLLRGSTSILLCGSTPSSSYEPPPLF